MSLFDGQPLTKEEVEKNLIRAGARPNSVTLKDSKGRTRRRRPFWMDVGKGPEGKTCADCGQRQRRANTWFKCGLAQNTRGPGTDIGARDQACARFQEKKGVT